MALRDDVFKATAATEIRNVFRAVPRSGKKSLELKIKREAWTNRFSANPAVRLTNTVYHQRRFYVPAHGFGS